MVWCQKPPFGIAIILGTSTPATDASHSPGDRVHFMGAIVPSMARHSKAALDLSSKGLVTVTAVAVGTTSSSRA